MESAEEYNAQLSEFLSFIEDLDNEQLKYLQHLIDFIGHSGFSYQLLGIINATFVHKRGLALDGRSYEEALGLSDTDKSDNTPDTPSQEDLMEKYGLANHRGSVLCAGCSRPFASVEDAVAEFKKNDGCVGCHHKAKWG